MGAYDDQGQTVKLPTVAHKEIETAIKTKRKLRKFRKKLAKKQRSIASLKAATLLKERRRKTKRS